jgi:PII-like signaling protein
MTEIRNTNGLTVYRVYGSEVKNTSGLTVYRIYSNEVKDTNGLTVYRVYGSEVKDTSGSTVYRIYSNEVKDTSGLTVYRIYADVQGDTTGSPKTQVSSGTLHTDAENSFVSEAENNSYNAYVSDINRIERRIKEKEMEELQIKNDTTSAAQRRAYRISSIVLLFVSGGLFCLMYFLNFPFILGTVILGAFLCFLVCHSAYIDHDGKGTTKFVAVIGGCVLGFIAGFVVKFLTAYEEFNYDIGKMVLWGILTAIGCGFLLECSRLP